MLENIERWTTEVDELAIILGFALLSFEIIRDLLRGRLSRLKVLDSLASLSTQIPFLAALIATFGMTVTLSYGVYYGLAPYYIPINPWTLLLAVLAADFVYYWEHRISHEVRLLWVSHAVHHSAPIMNTAVAFRFGVFDPLISLPSSLVLVLFGFEPLLAFFGQVVVLAYQTWIHTEVIGRLGILDRILNTPSNHRVHHGADEKYLDRNYGGILMLWDQLFGTYQREEETPRYGLKDPINTVNPIKVWFSEIPRLTRDLRGARSFSESIAFLFRPPGWKPAQNQR